MVPMHFNVIIFCVLFSALLPSADDEAFLELSRALDGAARLNNFEANFYFFYFFRFHTVLLCHIIV
jgi:hypothetical protein